MLQGVLILLLVLGALIPMSALDTPPVDAAALIMMVALPFRDVLTVQEALMMPIPMPRSSAA
jgi:hypothetical protein